MSKKNVKTTSQPDAPVEPRSSMLPISRFHSPYGPWQAAFDMDALRRAWTAVRANKGAKGSDGETVAQFEEQLEQNLYALHVELVNQQYQPRPVKQLLVPKKDERWRTLTIWAIRDRIVQRAVYNYLEPIFDRQFLPCSFGFRNGRSTKDAAEAILMARAAGAYWVLDADIEDCFGQMESGRLLRQLAQWRVPGPLRQLIKLWLNTRIGNAWRPDQTTTGTSQGSVISPLLCNLYLHPFDRAMQKPGISLIRYADDFVILSRHKAVIHSAEQWAGLNLRRLGLTMSDRKTRITNFNEGFQFVGWFFIRDEMHQLK